MIHWTGYGYKPFLVLFAVYLGLLFVTPESMKEYDYIVSLVVAALYSWKNGNIWNKEIIKTIYTNGEERTIVTKENHSFFWIKTQYWGLIFWGLAVYYSSKLSIWEAIVFILISLIYIAYKYYTPNLSEFKKEFKLKNKKFINKKKVPVNEIERIKKRYDKRYNKR